jgi:ATP-dependent RNA helicase MSS116
LQLIKKLFLSFTLKTNARSIMWKNTLSRQGRLCRLPLTAARQVQLVSKITSRPLTQAIVPRTNITSTSALSALSRFQPRLYSTDAATAEATPEVAPQRSTEPVTKFQDLRKLDVHENIVEALVRDFKYEDMTEVQSATINAALKGKDMYVMVQPNPATRGTSACILTYILQGCPSQDGYRQDACLPCPSPPAHP